MRKSHVPTKWIAGLMLGLFCAAGCVTEVVQTPEKEATLVVTRAGDTATLTWKAEKGITYVVMYSDGADAPRKWKVLPGAEHVQTASGEQITLTDRLPPGANRYYRLQILSAAK
jgi:hypothetical protein